MKQGQQSLISKLKEQRSVRKHLAVAVCLIAILTAFAVFWSLRISGLTLAEETATGTDATETDAEETATGTDGEEGTTSTTTNTSASKARTLLASSGTADTYYFADAASLNTAAVNQDESYIVYTIIDDTYYVVSADDTLVECKYLGDASDNTNPYDIDTNLVYDTADEGMYCWKDSNGNLTFKCTTSASDDTFDDYRWTLSSDDANDADGTGNYTFYNSENTVYIEPEDVGISETVNGTGWWADGCDYSENYALSANSVVIFTITCTDSVEYTDSGTTYTYDNCFNIELFGNNVYFTTESYGTSPWGVSDITVTSGSAAFYPLEGETYTVVVIRSTEYDQNVETSTYSITYYDSNGTFCSGFSASTTDIVGNDVYARMIAQRGTYNIGVTYATLKTANGTDNSGIENTYDSSNNSFSTTVTELTTTEKSGIAELKGDFDVTYTFTNFSYSAYTAGRYQDNFLFALNDGNDRTIYIYAYSGYEDATSKSNVVLYDGSTASSMTYTITADGMNVTTQRWRTIMNANNMNITIHVTRQQNIFTVYVYAARGTEIACDYTITFEDASFGTTTDLFLSGINCSLTNITISSDSAEYDIQSYDAYGITGTLSKELTVATSNDGWSVTATKDNKNVTFVANSSYYASFAQSYSSTANITFYLAMVREYTAWFDETNGGITVYNKLSDSAVTSFSDAYGNCYVTAPTESSSVDASYFTLTLRGWYDIYSKTYYEQGETFSITAHTVLYADWMLASYDHGSSTDSNLATTVSTSSFITTTLYDFNELFNLYSANMLDVGGYLTLQSTGSSETADVYQTVTAATHREVFTNTNTATSFMNSALGLNFMFFRTELYYFTNGSSHNPLIDDAYSRSSWNSSQGSVTQGILGTVGTTTNASSTYGKVDNTTNGLLTILFGTGNTVDDYTDKNSSDIVYGKKIVGTGDYLFKYDADTGYYSYDSSQNGASYNQTDGRFYVYNDTDKIGTTTYFLPYNDPGTLANTNYPDYWFGMNTEIEFYLADNVPDGNTDPNYGTANPSKDSNQTTTYHTTFKFSGDDDVWVFIDGVLVLDLGGVHGKVYGEIDFSTGEVVIVNDGTQTEINARGILDYTSGATIVHQTAAETYVQTLDAGSHTLSFYYLERGAGESNAAIYFNIASTTYNLDLSKLNEAGASLTGAEFTFYTDSAFTQEALLATTQDGNDDTSTFETPGTVYGLREGVTYYVKETAAPDGYTAEGKYFTVCLSGSALTIAVYDSTNTAQELYSYTVTCDINGNCTITKTNTASVTNSSSWDYILIDENSTFVTAKAESGAVAYYNLKFSIKNTKLYDLPATGSTGIRTYLLTGSVLTVTAGIGLVAIAFYQLVRLRRGLARANKKETSGSGGSGKRFKRTRNHPKECGADQGHVRDGPRQ